MTIATNITFYYVNQRREPVPSKAETFHAATMILILRLHSNSVVNLKKLMLRDLKSRRQRHGDFHDKT